MNKKDPLKTNVSDGLAKMHEAAELISEEKFNELAEKAKTDALENKKKADNKKKDTR
ncbi:hypothetical protein RZD29_002759 [Citrobacter amalonaticus]|nr:hypothetical protein [Citrobacter amalonaticus]